MKIKDLNLKIKPFLKHKRELGEFSPLVLESQSGRGLLSMTQNIEVTKAKIDI